MTKRFRAKVVVFGIVCVFLGTSVIPMINGAVPIAEQVVKQQQSTSQMNDENSVICGYVTDSETGDPLLNVYVEHNFEESEGVYGWNDTYTDATGFYLLHTIAAEFILSFSVDDYFYEHTQWMYVGENEIFWYNISLIPTPPETVYFFGFITDNASGAPVNGAHIRLYWYDNEGHFWHNETEAISSGYYCLGAIPGETYIDVYYDEYFNYNSEEYYTQNNSFIWLNISLIPYPPACAIICGYITDAELGDPIPNAYVSVYCNTENGQWYNSTIANAVGFYSVGSIQGTIHLHAFRQDYASTPTYTLDVNENETLWVNLTMYYEPMETSLIQGYVVDNEMHTAVRNAFVRFDWKDEIGHFYSKYTFTDQKGYYSITAPRGSLQFLITANGYSNQQTSWFFVPGYSEHWLNTTLTPEISVMFIKPQPGIYIFNESRFPILSKILSRFFPKSIPLIIGPLEITVNVTKSTLGCNRVEFYIDTIYRGTDSKSPYTYYWNQTNFFKHTHEIQVIAYDNAGPCTIETITVRKLL